MEIPAVNANPQQVTFAPYQRDYAEQEAFGRVQQQFYRTTLEESIRTAQGVIVPLIQTSRRHRMAEAQTQASSYLAENEESYRQAILNARRSGGTDAEISSAVDEINKTYREAFDEYGDSLVSPGSRRQFRQWSEGEFESWRLGAEVKAGTELRAVNQRDLFNLAETLAKSATRSNLQDVTGRVTALIAAAEADGTIRPLVAEELMASSATLAMNTAWRSAIMEMYDTQGYDRAVEMANGSGLKREIIDDLIANMDSQEARKIERANQEMQSRANEARSEFGDRFPLAYMGQGEAPTVYEIQRDPRLQGDDPYVMQTRQSLMNAALEYEGWLRDLADRETVEQQNAAIEVHNAEVLRTQQSVRAELDSLYQDPNVTPEEYRIAVAGKWSQAGFTEAQRDARMGSAARKIMSPTLTAYFEGVSTFFDRQIREATNAGDTVRANALAQRQAEADERLHTVLSSGEYESEQAREAAIQQVLQNLTDTTLAESVGGLTGLNYDVTPNSYKRGRTFDSRALGDAEELQRMIDSGNMMGRVDEFMPQLEALRDGYMREWRDIIVEDIPIIDARVSPANGRPVITFDAYRSSYGVRARAPIVPQEFVRRFSTMSGERQVFQVSFIERDNDHVPVAWSNRQNRWVEVAGVPGFDSVIRR